MKIEIITIGDEILIGQIVDTNSAWISQQLNLLNWEIVRITTVADKKEEIKNAFDAAFKIADIVLVTGGTGPTKDDVTKNVLCEYFGGELIFKDDIKENIETIFKNRNLALNELTLSQAYVPDNCRVLMNKVGTAPCTWFEKDNKILVSMAGVPSEMKWLMNNEVIPALREKFEDNSAVTHQHFLVKNYSESALAEKLEDFEKSLTSDFKLAYLPQPGVVKLRLTGRNHNKELLKTLSDNYSEELRIIIGNDIYSEEDKTLPILIGEALLKNKLTLSTAESCTGGNIAHLITEVPGCSAYFNGGIVSYSNEVKENVLGVSKVDLDQYGAVSEQVVLQMVKGACKVCNTDCAVATSGIAGPEGGTKEKPVGTIWIAAKYKEQVVAKLFKFGTIRENNIIRASNVALQMLLEMINK